MEKLLYLDLHIYIQTYRKKLLHSLFPANFAFFLHGFHVSTFLLPQVPNALHDELSTFSAHSLHALTRRIICNLFPLFYNFLSSFLEQVDQFVLAIPEAAALPLDRDKCGAARASPCYS
jgi:hypothetical protein